MKACHHAQVPGHLPYCTMALKERCKQEPCQAEKSLLWARIFRALRCFAAVQRAQNGPACQPRHAPKKCSHAPLQRRRAAGCGQSKASGLAVMGFGKRQDHLANDLALRGGELQKSIEGFALQIAHPLFPALAVLQHRLAYAFAKA